MRIVADLEACEGLGMREAMSDLFAVGIDGAGSRLVVVGASLAGLRAVETARQEGFTGEVILVGAEAEAPYDRPPLSKAFLAPGGPDEVEPFHSAAHLRDELGVDLRLGVRATGLDTEGRRVLLGDEDLAYDALVVATGAAPLPFPGDHLDGVHQLRTGGDALAVRAALDAGAHTVVVGAGFIGSEVASAARARGLDVTVLEAAPVPLARSLGEEVGLVVVNLHRAAGTDLRLGTGVAGLKGCHGRVVGVRTEAGGLLPADLVVLGTGVAPATGWLEQSGLALHERDRGVLCDATLATSAPGVWAAGDVAHAPNPLFDDDLMRSEHWTNAAEQGAAAARHALDPAAAAPLTPVPYFWSECYDHRLQFVGSTRAEEVLVLDGVNGSTTVALYRRGERIIGAFCLDGPRVVMKLRRRIAARGGFADAVAAMKDLRPA